MVCHIIQLIEIYGVRCDNEIFKTTTLNYDFSASKWESVKRVQWLNEVLMSFK